MFDGIIVKVDLSSFTRVTALALSPGEFNVTAGVIDTTNGYAYFGFSDGNVGRGRIVKVRLSDFTRFGAAYLAANEYYVVSAAIDTPSGFAYFVTHDGTYASPYRVAKVQLNGLFAKVASLTSTAQEYFGGSAVDATNGYLYVGGLNASTGFVMKVRLSDFT
ncbi:MAG: hypothetical protein HZC17_01960, partial [Candidatus Omnitrophica bacterium]|nr:hypothetical protein [Candidatus Omnitrophota bacterium]